jgi:ligand-binding sensor domain-containing protein
MACMLLASCPCAFALDPALDVSQYAHTAWKYRDGFTKGEIASIAQTPDGYLWLGTGFGLFRFDGIKPVLWQPPKDQHLPSSYVGRLVAARDGTLWIGTDKGLGSWKEGKLTQYPELAGLAVFVLLEDREGSIWAGAIGLPDGKLCEIQKGNVRCYAEVEGFGSSVYGLHEDARGSLWVGLEKGVWRWRPTPKTSPPEFYAVPNVLNGVQGMTDGEDGSLLLSTTGAVRRIANEKSQVAYPFPSSLREVAADHILRDRDGGLWVGTRGGGIVHRRQGRTDVFSQSDGLTSDRVVSLFEDREGNIWVATQNGLDRFRELPVVTYSTNQGFPSGAVLAARDGSIWFGTGNGLNRLRDGQITMFRQRSGGARVGVRETAVSGLPDHVESLFQDSRGRIWVSWRTGVGYLENDQFFSSPVPGGFVDTFIEDAMGNLWISNQEFGLFRLSPQNEVQKIPWDTFGRKDAARPLAFDRIEGGLWLGFYNGGVAWFHDGQVRASYAAADGLAEGRVNDLRFDREGALWAAAEGGLSRLKNGRIATLTSSNGLPCDAVQWTIEDDVKSIWLGMPCGLVRVARSELDAWAIDPKRTVQTTVFDNSDGAKMPAAVGGYSPHAAKSPTGRPISGPRTA